MGWIRKTRPRDQARCRPALESLEIRNLLSATRAHVDTLPRVSRPAPAQSDASFAPSPADVLIGASRARAEFGVNGSGMTAAVIDTGANYNHEALGGGFGPGKKVVAGYDFTDQDGDPNAKTWQHGTAVAGLIASSDPNHPGVAPGANIVPLRVFGDDNRGDYTWIADALQWVIDHHAQYNITVVNLSISDENNYTSNAFASDGGTGQQITALIGKLDALNIPVVDAAGNGFKGQQGMGFTAIIPGTISVTSTDVSDHLAPDAQRLGTAVGGDSATDLAAPGVNLAAPLQGNSFGTVQGTSFSTPEVTGAVILLQQIYRSRFGQLPTVAQLEGWLKAGADPIFDPTTGITIGRLDIPRAASLIPQAPAPPPAQPAPGPVGIPTSAPATPPPAQGSTSQAVSTPDPPTTPPPPAPPAPLPDPTPTPVPPAPVPPPVTVPTPPAAPAPPAPGPPPTHVEAQLVTQVPPSPSPPAQAPVSPPVQSVQAPAAPTPPPAPVKPNPAPPTAVFVNGQSVSPDSTTSQGDSWSDYLSAFGFPMTLDRVQVWSGATLSRAKPQGQLEAVADNTPATVRIETRRQPVPHGSLRLAGKLGTHHPSPTGPRHWATPFVHRGGSR